MKTIIITIICILSMNAMAGNVGVPDEEKASAFFHRSFNDHIHSPIAFSVVSDAPAGRSLTLEGEFGVLKTTGNTNTSLYKMALDADHDLPKLFNQYSIQALKQLTTIENQRIDTSRLQMALEFDYKLSNIENRLFLFAEYDDNQFLALRDQITGAVGWRQLWIDNDVISFGYSIGPGYAHFRQEDAGESFEGLLLRSSAAFSYTFHNDARFRQVITAEINEAATTVNSITSATAKIFNDLALKFSFEVTKDENVAANIDDFSTQTSITLVYQFF
ncbi:MAG: DUF481 domain-containing protein [Pseudomonadota bacterium]